MVLNLLRRPGRNKQKDYPDRPQSHSFSAAGKKEVNEDYARGHELPSGMGIYVICDGLSGHNGKDASTDAATAFVDGISSLEQEIEKSSSDEATTKLLVNEAEKVNQLLLPRGESTTITAVLIAHKKAYIIHAGDSRAYLFHTGGMLKQVTEDHSFVQEQLTTDTFFKTPDEARVYRGRHAPRQHLGQSSPSFFTDVLPLSDVKYILLTTDGLTDIVLDEEMQTIVAREPPRAIPLQLVERALTPQGFVDYFIRHSIEHLPFIEKYLKTMENGRRGPFYGLQEQLGNARTLAEQRETILRFCQNYPVHAKKLTDAVAHELGGTDNATALLVDIRREDDVARYVASLHNNADSPQRVYDILKLLAKQRRTLHVPVFDGITSDFDLYPFLSKARENGVTVIERSYTTERR